MASDDDDPVAAGRTYLFVLCGKFSFTRQDRLELASVVLDRNITSFKQLGPIDIARMRDALHGAVYAARIMLERRQGLRQGPR